MTCRSERRGRGRSLFLVAMLLAFLAAVIGRGVQLQLLEGKRFYGAAQKQRKRSIPLVSNRGNIYSRNLKELALTLQVDSLYAIPNELEDRKAAAKTLARLVSMDQELIAKRLSNGKSFVWIKRWMTREKAQQVRDKFARGIDFAKEGRRFYPLGSLAGQVLGFAGLDGEGLEGLELAYHRIIRGKPGSLLAERDARGRFMLPAGTKVAGRIKGHSLILTLDENIQYIAEKELKRGVIAAQAKRGNVIVLEPASGEILAMANWPPFDPNYFWKYRASQWRNLAITDMFEPGSTMKIFTVAAALEEKVLKPTDLIYTEQGVFRIGRRVIHDVHPYGWLSLEDVIKVSSNIGAAKVGLRLGRRRLYRYLKNFGFFAPSRVDLRGEEGGLHQPLKRWSNITIANISFGQGIALTPLQLAVGYAALANGGFLMKPYLVKKVVDDKGRLVNENRPQVVRKVISTNTSKLVRRMLMRVIGPEGTGRRAKVDGYAVAGKTGTAQKPSRRSRGYAPGKYVASFVGWAPAENPQILILVVIDEPRGVKYGGVLAAPVFKEIASQTLAYLRVSPDRLNEIIVETEAKGQLTVSRYVPDLSLFSNQDKELITMPDFRGLTLRQILELASHKGIQIKTRGSGIAVWQKPTGGSLIRLERVGLVKLSTASRVTLRQKN